MIAAHRGGTRTWGPHIAWYVFDDGPDGGLSHADGSTDDRGWWSFELYASEEHFARFNGDILAPAFAQAGMGEAPFSRPEVAWDSTQPPT